MSHSFNVTVLPYLAGQWRQSFEVTIHPTTTVAEFLSTCNILGDLRPPATLLHSLPFFSRVISDHSIRLLSPGAILAISDDALHRPYPQLPEELRRFGTFVAFHLFVF